MHYYCNIGNPKIAEMLLLCNDIIDGLLVLAHKRRR